MMQVEQPQQAFAGLPDLDFDAWDAITALDMDMDMVTAGSAPGPPVQASFSDCFGDLGAWDGIAATTDTADTAMDHAPIAKASPPPANSPFSGVLIPQGAAAAAGSPTPLPAGFHFAAPPTPPTSPEDMGSIDGDSSGNESGGGGDTTIKPKGARRAPTRRPKAGAAAGRQQQQPRKKWKCSKEFLLASIEDRERAQLVAKGVPVPARGACPTLVSKAQEAELRKALRRIRNVESAKRSREHQKTHQIELEKSVAEVRVLNDTLASENAALKQQNQTLLQQLALFRKQLGGDGAALFMVILCCGISCAPNTFLTAAGGAASAGIPGGGKFRSRTLLMVEDEPAPFFGSLDVGAAGVSSVLACLVIAAVALAAALLAVHAVRRTLKLPAIGDFSSDSSLAAVVFGKPTRTASGKAAF